MASPTTRIILKVLQLFGCIACVMAKIITDLESMRVFYRNQKNSREWSLIHNVTWSSAGNAFANVTYGGYMLITAIMLISRCYDSQSNPMFLEKTLIFIGMLCFFAMGAVVFAAIDQIPEDLIDNAVILGCLSFVVAFLMLIDLFDPMAPRSSQRSPTSNRTIEDINSHNPAAQSDVINMKSLSNSGDYQRSDDVDTVHSSTLPIAQTPVFEKILMPEKLRPVKQQSNIQQANRFDDPIPFNGQVNQALDHVESKCQGNKSPVRMIRRGYVASTAKLWNQKLTTNNVG